MQAVIAGIGAAVPPNRVTNDDLAKTIDTSDEWIRSHTGIGARHIADEDTSTSDLGLAAARQALERAKLAPEDIDFIIVATASPDYPGFPAVGNIIQEKIGAKCGAMDLAAGCTGFIYAIETGRAFVVSGTYKNVLVIGAETLTKITNWEDRSSCVLFGDGAGAVVLTARDGDDGRGVHKSILASDGSGWDALVRPAGGSRNPIKDDTPHGDTCINMDGRRVYNFAVRVNTELLQRILEDHELDLEGDVAWIVPHQANERIIQAAAKRMKLPMDKFYMNIEEYANTSGASIPLALNEMYEKGLLHEGDTLILMGFGAGLTYGATVVVW